LDETDAQQQPYWPELEVIARPARERRRLPPDVRRHIIINLCRRAPLSVKDLSILLDRSEAYIGDAIRPLVSSGELTFLFPDQPRHPRQKYIGAPENGITPGPIIEPEDVEELAVPTRLESSRTPAYPRPVESPAPSIEPPAPALPNQATNLVFVVVIGLILALTEVPYWWASAAAASIALSWLHIATNSRQYRQFGSLKFLRNRATGFLLLKSTVAFVEIAAVYLVVTALS
jgi:hypothetical protein